MLISHQDRIMFTQVLKKLKYEFEEPLTKVCKPALQRASVLEDLQMLPV